MESAVLTTLIEVEGKKFTLKTSPVTGRNRLSSDVELEGRLLSHREEELPEGLGGQGLYRLIREAHDARTAELGAFFKLSRKIEEKPAADSCWKIGSLFLANGFYEDARLKFLKAVELDPRHVQAMKKYGITLTLLGDFDGAIAALNRVKELAPTFSDVYYHLGNAFLSKRKLDEAVQSYLQALQINPRYADARLHLAAACVGYLVQSGETLGEPKAGELLERARTESETAASLNPKLRSRAFFMALDFLRQRKFLLAFQNFLEVRPWYVPRIGEETIFFFELSLFYGVEEADLAMAERYIRKLSEVIEEYPQYADLRHHLGLVRLFKCWFEIQRAVADLQKALDINPQFQKAAWLRSECEDLRQRLLSALKKGVYSV